MTPFTQGTRPESESLKQLLLDMADTRSLDALLELTVGRLAERPHVALARVWLLQPGDICDDCPKRNACPGRVDCLHLVASDGRSTVDPALRWNRLDGGFRRFPFGKWKVGRVAATGEPEVVWDLEREGVSMVDPDWIQCEGIRGVGVQPLRHHEKILGSMAVFTRVPLEEGEVQWLRMLADHLSSAITTVRAFAEIKDLKTQIELENEYLREEVAVGGAFGEIIGSSPALLRVLRQIELVADTDAAVLILGETGTGKELVAREIHQRSGRRNQPLIKVNCAAIPRELYESEFFGHVKGAFSGAVRDRAGRFEAADGGTLFLDEIGELPADVQSKLLRVLQEGSYERVGDDRTRTVDVRIIAATNRDLAAEVAEGRFREDLYYRINVFPVDVAPLRARRDDIPDLAAHFIELTARRMNRPVPALSRRNVGELEAYHWPGNVRELQNVIERAMIVSPLGSLRFDLPSPLSPSPQDPMGQTSSESEPQVLTEEEIRRLERDNLVRALELANWKISGAGGAAEILGVNRSTLASRMRKLSIQKPADSAKLWERRSRMR